VIIKVKNGLLEELTKYELYINVALVNELY